MAYVSYRKRSSYRTRRPFRRTTRSTRRSRRPGRYTRLRRTRATVNYSKQGGRVISRKTQVKFPFTYSDRPTIAAGADYSITFVGNALVPVSSDYTIHTPAVGDAWAAGVTEYAGFYDKFRVDGSSLKMNVSTTTGGAALECVLIALPVTETSISSMITTLNNLDYDNIMAWQYATWKLLHAGGNNQSVWFNKFRRTRNMLSYKDAGDVSELLSELPQIDGSGGTKWPPTVGATNTQWIYYLRIFNTTQNATTANILAKMVQYTTLQNLRFRSQTEVPEP